MNKKLLTTMIGAALATAPMFAAQADVKVYGMVQAEVASEDVDLALAGTSDEFLRTGNWQGGDIDPPNGASQGSVVSMEDNARGRFGIKADEDLGGGLTGLAVIEYDLGDTTATATTPAIRHASVGLQGGFGTFLMGTLKTPYKYTGGVKYDPFVTTNLEARRNGGMTGGVYGHNSFISNSIGYMTPKGSPVAVWATYSPDENGTATTGSSGSGGDDGDYTLSLKISDKAWEAFIATAKNKHNVAAGTVVQDYTATKVGGKYSFGNSTILVQYEDTDEDQSTSGATNEGQQVFVGYHLKLASNNTLVVQLGQGELEFKGTTSPKQEHDYFTVGAIHNFSKTTRVFAGYSATDVTNEAGTDANDGERTAFSVGLRKDF